MLEHGTDTRNICQTPCLVVAVFGFISPGIVYLSEGKLKRVLALILFSKIAMEMLTQTCHMLCVACLNLGIK